MRTKWALAYWLASDGHIDPAEDHPLAGFFLWEMGSGGQIEGDGSEAGDVLCCPDLLTNCLQTKPTTKKDLQPKAVSP